MGASIIERLINVAAKRAQELRVGAESADDRGANIMLAEAEKMDDLVEEGRRWIRRCSADGLS